MRDEMRIESITLYNYRQYYGEVTVNFVTKENTFSIIVGSNGAGKSNLWNAIHWCLFNEEPHLKGNSKPPIINKKHLQENKDSQLTTYVEMRLVKNKNRYRIRRTITGTLENSEKDENKMIKMSKSEPVPADFFITNRDKPELFQISKNDGRWKDYVSGNNFPNLVNEHIIPKNLAKFFVLDGEFLQDLFDEFKNIKSGIDQISQINVLDNTLKAARGVKFNRPKGSGKTDEIGKKIDYYELQLASEDKYGKKMYSDTKMVYGTEDRMHVMGHPCEADLEKAIKNIDEELYDLKKQISNSSATLKLENITKYEKKLKQKNLAENELKQLIARHTDNLVNLGPHIMCREYLRTAAKLIKIEMSKGKLPNAHKRMMIGDLLEKGECLCGSILEDGTDARRRVEDEIKRIMEQEQYDIASNIRSANEHFLNDYAEKMKQLHEEMEKVNKEKQNLRSLKEELADLKRQIPPDNTNYKELIDQQDNLQANRDEHFEHLGRVRSEIATWTKEKGELMRQYNIAQGRTRKDKEAMLTIQKSNLVLDILEKIKHDVGETIRDRVAKETLEIYNKMTWKKNYTNLRIDDEYQISVRGNDGIDMVGGKAAGEKLFLALSFIMALKKITDYRFPFVIDSPLGKAGGTLKINFGKYMPKLLSGSQMIMLATNTEYSKDRIRSDTGTDATHTLKELLEQGGTVREYEINFDKEAETAKIVVGRRF